MDNDMFYTLRGTDTIICFLASHPDVAELLLEARAHLKRCFGKQIKVTLEVVQEYDAYRMWAYIHTTSVADAMAQLDHLDESWFLDRIRQTGALFNFNLVFGDDEEDKVMSEACRLRRE